MRELLESVRDIIEADLKQRFGWDSDAYTLKARQYDDDTKILVVWALRAMARKAIAPGGGESVEILVDVGARRVQSVLHFQ